MFVCNFVWEHIFWTVKKMFFLRFLTKIFATTFAKYKKIRSLQTTLHILKEKLNKSTTETFLFHFFFFFSCNVTNKVYLAPVIAPHCTLLPCTWNVVKKCMRHCSFKHSRWLVSLTNNANFLDEGQGCLIGIKLHICS